jgi:hypothetical protein
MRLFYRKKMLENRHFLIGIFQHFTTVADIDLTSPELKFKVAVPLTKSSSKIIVRFKIAILSS